MWLYTLNRDVDVWRVFWLTHCLCLWVDFVSHHRSALAALSDSGSARPAPGSGQTRLGTRSSSTWETASGEEWEKERESEEFSKAWNRSPCNMKTMSALGGLATAIFSMMQCYKSASNWARFIYRSVNRFDSRFDSRLTWQDDKSESGTQLSNSETCYAVTVNLHFVSVIQYKKGVKNEHVTVPSISHADSAGTWQTARSAKKLDIQER